MASEVFLLRRILVPHYTAELGTTIASNADSGSMHENNRGTETISALAGNICAERLLCQKTVESLHQRINALAQQHAKITLRVGCQVRPNLHECAAEVFFD
jgi:hypothetical protein